MTPQGSARIELTLGGTTYAHPETFDTAEEAVALARRSVVLADMVGKPISARVLFCWEGEAERELWSSDEDAGADPR